MSFVIERAATAGMGHVGEAQRRALAGRIALHLARFEAENNLPIGLATAMADGWAASEGAELLLASAGSASAAALLMTPPYRLVVSFGDEPGARETLLEDLRARRVVPPGVVGPEPAASEVAAWWAQREGLTVRRNMRQGIYRLTAVTPSARAAGTVRLATPADEGLLLPWLHHFFVEARVDVSNPEEMFKRYVDGSHRRMHVFEVAGEAVSIAGIGGRTPNGRRIGPVYTPPEHRRRGYAEALVALVSADVLADGSEFCFLFTDLDNPTSNAVYERIGYELVTQSAEYDLMRPA